MALSARLRLRGPRCFDHLYQRGRTYHGQWMSLRVVSEQRKYLKRNLQSLPPSPFRCAVVVSTKISKSSVRRNFLRRLLHEYLGTILSISPCSHDKVESLEQPPSRWLMLSLKPGSAEIDAVFLIKDCLNLFSKAELYL